MLIYICGPEYAGRCSVANYLVSNLKFVSLSSTSEPCTHKPCKSRCPLAIASNSNYWKKDSYGVLSDCHLSAHPTAQLAKRPWVLIVYVNAPFLIRFQRAVASSSYTEQQLSEFITNQDFQLNQTKFCTCSSRTNNTSYDAFDPNQLPHYLTHNCDQQTQNPDTRQIGLSELDHIAHLHIFNNYQSIQQLHKALANIDFKNQNILRPGWDAYFISLAKLAAERSNCMKRRVGCVIARNRRIVATGYNGTPSGVTNCLDGGCPRCNGNASQGLALDLCLCLHAEENAIIEAGRERCEGSTLYSSLFPCILCSKKIVQAGVSRVVFDMEYATDNASRGLLKAGGITVDKFAKHGPRISSFHMSTSAS